MEIDTIMADKLLKRSKKMKSLDGGAGAKLGAAKTEAAIVNRNMGAAQVAGGAMSMFVGGANVAAGNFGLGLVGIGFGSSMYSSGMARIDKGLGQKETGKMISRQGNNVARSPRMAETLSMASMETGVRGPQSNGNAMPSGYDQQSFETENRKLGYSTAQEFRRLDAMDSDGDAMTPQQTSRHGSLHSRMSETASGFAAANAKFAGNRGSTASKQAKGSRADQPKSDGYVEAHTRRQGTKSVQIKQRRMTAAEKNRSR